jgi:hypothetical protein
MIPEGKFVVTKFDFVESFGMSLEEDYHMVEDTPKFELLVTFGMSLGEFVISLQTHY